MTADFASAFTTSGFVGRIFCNSILFVFFLI
jgi:hypothetical protein